MNWLELGQRLEGLIEELNGEEYEDYLETAKAIQGLIEKALDLMDNPLEER